MNKTKSIRKIALHLLFWVLNYWLFAFVVHSDWNGFNNVSDPNSLAYAYTYGLFTNVFLFYIQVFWLVPKMYMHNKKAMFYVLSFSICIAVSLVETYFDYMLYDIFEIYDTDEFEDNFSITVFVNVFYGVAGFYYILRHAHKKSEKEKQQLIQESFKAELKYLKAQLNPHFLFNGINNVYHLIGKNNALAKDTLLQFSELLRYQLYESGTEIILKKELDFVLQYIKMEKTRKGSDIQLAYIIEFENATKKIVPLLLIPIIENAFKHCSNHTNNNDNSIDINIKEVGGKLSLHCANTFDGATGKNAVGGIGLTNVKKRLSIVYPDKHELIIHKKKQMFMVDLIIEL
ncbi:sensor histidine kinase [Flagellimonas sp. HMM57]|uniref:sensor histidine kinase n=1 Tax=unclassified Flagellimonas TaxID=2644544 RepID=UPI0013D41C3C|nr:MULTISPECIES: sensor histidine kinase [unclassified Flagellimonas]UII75079.1 sensor histidine kinase [Flagellimonas sp. HMM57]